MEGHEHLGLVPVGSTDFYINAGAAFLCVLGAALAAGLTMGLVAIEPLRLEILLATKEEHCTSEKQVEELRREKICAAKILPVVSRHHLLLVTLLLLNSAANECLPLFLDEIVPTSLAILLSVTFVLLFGEIIPSAIFTGPNQLYIASAFIPVVQVAQFLLFPIAWPISKILDYLLGEEDSGKFNKAELRALVRLHGRTSETISSALDADAEAQNTSATIPLLTEEVQAHGVVEPMDDGQARGIQKMLSTATEAGLSIDEIMIMHGAMDLKDRTVMDILIPLSRVFMLSMDTELSHDVMVSLLAAGHSRVPVYDGHDKRNIRGLLMVKTLIVINPADCRRVSTLGLRQPVAVHPSLSLLELLNVFQTGSSHMALVTDQPYQFKEAIHDNKPVPKDVVVHGVCTLEDVMEALIKEDIADETDANSSVRLGLFRAQRIRRLGQLAKQEVQEAMKMKIQTQIRANAAGSRPKTHGLKSLASTIGSAATIHHHSPKMDNTKSASSYGSIT